MKKKAIEKTEEELRKERARQKLKYKLGYGHWTNETYRWNEEYKKMNNIKYPYYVGLRKAMPKKVKIHEKIIVIEMNNDTNKIIGFALVKNNFKDGIRRGIRMYPKNTLFYWSLKGNAISCPFGWNSLGGGYIYSSKKYIDVEQFEGCEYIEEVIEMMEERLFRGCNHYKRGIGIQLIDVTKFPNYDRVVLFLNNLFD